MKTTNRLLNDMASGCFFQPGFVMRRLIYLLPIFSAVLIAGCSKGLNVPGKPGASLSADGLAYIQMTAGKYYIYRDSVMNTTDSVVVTKSQFDVHDGYYTGPGGPTQFNAQQYTLILSQMNGNSPTEWLTGQATANLYISDFIMSPINNTSGIIFRYPVCNCSNQLSIAAMTVAGKTYTNVINISGALVVNNVTVNISFYWAKGIGLIKRTETTSAGTNTYLLLRND
jgi:hypothetical protein